MPSLPIHTNIIPAIVFVTVASAPFTPITGVNYTLYADNRTSGLPSRATFRSSGSNVISNQASLFVSSATCALEIRETVYVDNLFVSGAVLVYIHHQCDELRIPSPSSLLM